MAGVDSKDSLLGLSGLFYTQASDVEDGSLLYPWQAQIKKSRDTTEVERILEERCVQVRQLHENAAEGERHLLEDEWLALVMAKDKNLRLKIDQDNEKMKQLYMKKLHTTLEVLGSFNFNKPNEVILRRNLAKIYQQVGKYCSKNGIDTMKGSSPQSHKEVPKSGLAPPPPPPPPPPPSLPPPVSKSGKPDRTPVHAHKRRKVLSEKEPSNKSDQCTPLKSLNAELMNRIRGSKVSDLRSTPCKRSPGGTPMRQQRRLSESDTSDLITVALRRKFKNVAVQSPNENRSPNVMSPATDF